MLFFHRNMHASLYFCCIWLNLLYPLPEKTYFDSIEVQVQVYFHFVHIKQVHGEMRERLNNQQSISKNHYEGGTP